MAPVVPFIPLITAVVGAGATAYSVYSQKKAADKARDVGNLNAANVAKENAEHIRRLEDEQERSLSMSKARALASNVELSGSPWQYLEEMDETYEEDVDWLRRSGASRAEIERMRGEVASDTATAGMWGSVGGMFSSMGSLYSGMAPVSNQVNPANFSVTPVGGMLPGGVHA